MAKVSFSGWKDPATRPRYIIWSAAAVIVLAVFTIAALGATSTYWFCANGCHKVQDDSIAAYNNSAHSQVNCYSCHMPANADPVTFLLHKVVALGEVYLTVTGDYEIPLNGESHLAMDADHMGSGQCTQCHSDNREVTPTRGIIIDHEIHEENAVHCTVCHNRTAHNENGIELVNVDPTTGEANHGHEDFMEMQACFRCHSHEPDAIAPGACEACHPPAFELKPENHLMVGFYEQGGESAGHAELAQEASAEVSVTTTVAEEEAVEEASHEEDVEEGHEGEGVDLHALPSPAEINYCATCHSQQFCTDCHGLPMPHPTGFQEDHGVAGREAPEVCANCHAKGGAGTSGTEFCNSCHHPDGDPTQPWISQHYEVVARVGANECFDCHNPTYCAECHVKGIDR
jgi:hypothetical protein